jgi:putative oxidoreductase
MTYLPLAARICLSLIFLNAGINHVMGFQKFVDTIASKGLPLPQVLEAGTIAFLLLGSLSLLLGYQTKIGAILIILFLIPATLLFHPIPSDLAGFLNNVALIGGLLMVVAYGPGLISIDGSKSR